jgi:ABC-2 type transport system permease protein
VVKQSGIVKKVAFPREILALSTVGTSAVYFAMQFVVLAGLMAVLGRSPDWGLLWLLPLAFVALTFLASALGVFLSAINVYFRDAEHLVSVGITLWFWLTPIVYSFENKVSPMLHRHGVLWVYFLNPVTPIVMTFQRVLYRTVNVVATTPDHSRLVVLPTWPASQYALLDGVLLAVGMVALLAATSVFGRLEGNFAEEL